MTHNISTWKLIDSAIDHLEYAKMMHESFGDEAPSPTLEEELRRELTDNHPLKNSQFKALYYQEDNPNEFIFTTDHIRFPAILVHLTWQNEKDPMFPVVSLIDISNI